VTERKIPTHRSEPQRFTLYLPGELLDLAEDLARRAGAPTPQHYCEDLLVRALRLEEIERDSQVGGIVASALDSLDGYVQEESLDTDRDVILDPAPPINPAPSARADAPFRFRVAPALPDHSKDAPPETAAEPTVPTARPTDPIAPLAVPSEPFPSRELPGRSVALRHAALEAPFDARAFLALLRRGQTVGSAQVDELLDALETLVAAFDGGRPLDRELARSLHRLAYEPQVLISEAWPALAHDQATLLAIREVQNSVERIFEGGVQTPVRAGARGSP
jgi:hypothetical protein